MQWFISIAAGIAVAFAWLAIWALSLHAFGISAFARQVEDRASRRERIKRMGKLRYILIFGVLGSGLGFGLALVTADFLRHDSFGWISEIVKLAFLTVFFGWFLGARTWSETFRDPVPFPPNYPPAK